MKIPVVLLTTCLGLASCGQQVIPEPDLIESSSWIGSWGFDGGTVNTTDGHSVRVSTQVAFSSDGTIFQSPHRRQCAVNLIKALDISVMSCRLTYRSDDNEGDPSRLEYPYRLELYNGGSSTQIIAFGKLFQGKLIGKYRFGSSVNLNDFTMSKE